jgi:hypothetical protein
MCSSRRMFPTAPSAFVCLGQLEQRILNSSTREVDQRAVAAEEIFSVAARAAKLRNSKNTPGMSQVDVRTNAYAQCRSRPVLGVIPRRRSCPGAP